MDAVRRQSEGVETLLGDPKKAIIKLSIFMTLGSFGQIMLSLVDAIFISGLGADALSAVGFFIPVFLIILSIATGISMGGRAALARMIGGRDDKGADDIAAHTMISIVLMSVSLAIPLIIFYRPLFSLLGAGDTIDLTTAYGRIMLIGAPLLSFSIAASAVLAAEGDTKRGAQVMILAAILNIILDPIFIYTLQLGVAGAALASVISLFIGSSVFIYWFFIKKNTYVSVKLRKFRFKKLIFLEIFNIGVPFFVSQIFDAVGIVIGNLIIVKIAGTDGVAVFAAGSRVIHLIALPIFGLLGAFGSVAASAYGANDIDKLDTSLKYVMKIGFIIQSCLTAVTFILAPVIIKSFIWSGNTVRIAEDLITFFRILVFALPAIVIFRAGFSLFIAVGKGLNGLKITILNVFLLGMPCMWFLGVYLNMGLVGAWVSVIINNWITAIIVLSWVKYFINVLRKNKIKLKQLELEKSCVCDVQSETRHKLQENATVIS